MRIRITLAAIVLVSGVARANVPNEQTGLAGPYNCDGTTGPYAVPYKFLANSDLVVTRTTGGTKTTLAIGTDYSVTGAGGSSGTVTLVAGSRCPSGTTLTITRKTPKTQPATFSTQSFNPKAAEIALDRTVLQVQELADLYGPLAAAAVGPQGPPGSISAIGSNLNFGNAYRDTNQLDPVNPQDGATKNYVDTTRAPIASPTFTGTVTVPTLVVNTAATVPSPTLSGHAATKGYVDTPPTVSWSTLALGGNGTGGVGNSTPAYWRDRSGVVHLRGTWTANITNANVIVASSGALPAGFRPLTGRFYLGTANVVGTAVPFYVGTDGGIDIASCSSGVVYALDGISFVAEQ